MLLLNSRTLQENSTSTKMLAALFLNQVVLNRLSLLKQTYPGLLETDPCPLDTKVPLLVKAQHNRL